MTVITRFAPSPTGFLHIGGARTALFNYLFARHHRGTYALRIEDTDKNRSTTDAINAIVNGLNWLGLNPDTDIVYQSKNIARHRQVVQQLIDSDKAYYCYTPPEELHNLRQQAEKNGQNFTYDRRWRDTDKTPPVGVKPVVRLKCPLQGQTTINDLVQGKVVVNNTQLDDYILLRSDGTPTYMLSVVVDDIDMGITHIIRGDDHLNNAVRQVHLFKALRAKIPAFAHIPLIHGPDGKKLSKRHGALSIESYKDMGYIPQALKNYLCRLGWSHGDREIFTEQQAITWFSTDGIGTSPSRMDFDKLAHINAHYLRQMDTDMLLPLVLSELGDISDIATQRISKGLNSIKSRATVMGDFHALCAFYISAPTFPLGDPTAQKMIKQNSADMLQHIVDILTPVVEWHAENLEHIIQTYIADNNLKFGQVGPPMRATLAGTVKSPSLFEMMDILGKQETLKRLSILKST